MFSHEYDLNNQNQQLEALLHEKRIRQNKKVFVGYSFTNDMVKNYLNGSYNIQYWMLEVQR